MADRSISMLEYEKTTSLLLDEEIRELKARKQELGRTKSGPELACEELKAKVLILQHEVDVVLTKASSTAAHNRRLKADIDTMRMSTLTEQGKLNNLETQRQALADFRLQESAYSSQVLLETHKLNLASTTLRSRSTSQRLNFQDKFQSLSVKSKQRELRSSSVARSISHHLTRLADVNPRYKTKAENLEPGVVLKKLKAKWTEIVASQATKNYQEHLRFKRMQKGLEQMRSSCGGLDIEEVVTTFIKYEKQQKDLSIHLSNLQLNRQISERDYRRIQESVDSQQTSTDTLSLTTQKMVQDRVTLVNSSKRRLRRLTAKAEAVDEQVRMVREVVERVVHKCADHGLTTILPVIGTSLLGLPSHLVHIEALLEEIVLFKALKESEDHPSLKLVHAMSNRELVGDSHPAIEVIKLNEVLTQHEDSSADLLTLSQLKARAKHKITIVEKMSIDELPTVQRRVSMMIRKAHGKRGSMMIGTN
jgi:hypothetical protein